MTNEDRHSSFLIHHSDSPLLSSDTRRERNPMKRALIRLLACFLFASTLPAQTPPPAPVPASDKKAEPKKPEKAEQEPRPESQELQKQQSQKKDAPPAGQATPPSPNPITAEGAAEK